MNVETWDVKATLAFPQRRDEVQALLKMVLEKGALTASDVVHRQQGLLPGRAKIMGERLLTMVADLNLLKQDGDRWSLTELGQASVEEGQTYVPEDDLWRFHWSDDPLVKSPLLHVQRIPPANRWDRDNTPTKPTTNMHTREPVVRDACTQWRRHSVCASTPSGRTATALVKPRLASASAPNRVKPLAS